MTYIDRDIKTIGKHVNNAIEKELEGIPTVTKFATVQNEGERLVLFESEDKSVSLSVPFENETVWLNQSQMTQLFSVNRTVITKHVNNVFKEKEVDEKSNVHFLHIANSDKNVKFYSLDVIISVGYRVKSKHLLESLKEQAQKRRQSVGYKL